MSSVVYTIILVAVAIAVAAVAVGLWYLAADLWLGPLARRLRAARSLGPTRSKLADLLRRNAVVRTDAAPRFWASVVSMPGRRLRGLLEQAHWRRTPGQIVLWSVACGFVGLAGGTLAGLSRPAAAALALGAAALPTAWLVLSCRRRLRRVEQQMPSALDALVNSLQCGHTLQESLRGAVDATAEPLREDLAAILQSVDLGAPWDDALDAFARLFPTAASASSPDAARSTS
jgi:tight adherence protein B